MAGLLVWRQRWMSDDGYINVRIIEQVLHGNGPVFNAGERVEAGTSTLWLASVALVRWVVPAWTIPQIMIVLGTIFMVLALGLLGAAAARAIPTSAAGVLPFGVVVLALLPPMWDFGTAGLETSLSLLWIAACLRALVHRWRASQPGPKPAWQPIWVAVLIGAGPLVRPDLALVMVVFLVMLAVQSSRTLRSLVLGGVTALALPVIYEVFRMGYYANLVPNTVLAKASGTVGQGLAYGWDYVSTFHVWIPLLLGGVALVPLIRRAQVTRDRGLVALRVGPPIAGAVHVLSLVLVGGDFMSARLLLPATALALAPVAVVARTARHIGVVALTAVYAVACALVLRAPLMANGIANERQWYVDAVGSGVGTMSPEAWGAGQGYGATLYRIGTQAALDLTSGRSYVLVAERGDLTESDPIPTASGRGVVLIVNSLGIVGVTSGLDVHIIDRPSLTDPIGARMDVPRTGYVRPGHALKPDVWGLARFADPTRLPDDEIEDVAREVLACEPLATLQKAVTEPMTVSRFWANMRLAPTLTRLSFSPDPRAAITEDVCRHIR